jgi:HEAT repeat protein
MSPLTVFLRTLAKSTAIFLGAGAIFLNPSLELSGSRAVTAQKSPAEMAADMLISALKDTDAGVRRQAAHSLGQMRSSRAVPALMDAMKDENGDVRAQAMWALAEAGDRRATPVVASPHPHPMPNPMPRANPHLARHWR